MKVKPLFFCLFALILISESAKVFAERKVLDVPCIGQVMDMDQSKFLGYNACGPTSAVMIVRFFHLQPDAPQGRPEGYYVYNGYDGFTDRFGNSYNSRFARDEDGPNSGIYPHSVCGAHGFIVDYRQKDGVWTWLTIQDYLETYLENHGLQTSGSIYSNLFSIVKQNIDSGLPLIGHLTSPAGHFLVITGYDGGNIIVNDPFGDLNGTWNGSTEGNDVTYPLNGSIGGRTVVFDHVIPAYPIGLFGDGWHDENFSLQSGRSQAFVNAYRSDVGIPADNNGGGIYVHRWRDNDGNYVIIQDYAFSPKYGQDDGRCALIYNEDEDKAYLMQGGFWGIYKVAKTNSSFFGMKNFFGPRDLGPPKGEEIGNNSSESIIQYFRKGYLVWRKVSGSYFVSWNSGSKSGKEYLIIPSWDESNGSVAFISNTLVYELNQDIKILPAKKTGRNSVHLLSEGKIILSWQIESPPTGGTTFLSYSTNGIDFSPFASVPADIKIYNWQKTFPEGTEYWVRAEVKDTNGLTVEDKIFKFVYKTSEPVPTFTPTPTFISSVPTPTKIFTPLPTPTPENISVSVSGNVICRSFCNSDTPPESAFGFRRTVNVFHWLKLSSVPTQLEIRWQWYSPEDYEMEIFSQVTTISESSSSKSLCGEFPLPSYFNFNRAGTWLVRVFCRRPNIGSWLKIAENSFGIEKDPFWPANTPTPTATPCARFEINDRGSESFIISDFGDSDLPDFNLSYESTSTDSDTFIFIEVKVVSKDGSRQDFFIGNPRICLYQESWVNNWREFNTAFGTNQFRFYSSICCNLPTVCDLVPGLTISEICEGNSAGSVNWGLLSAINLSEEISYGSSYQANRIFFKKSGSGSAWIRNIVVNGIHFNEKIFTHPDATPTPFGFPTPTPFGFDKNLIVENFGNPSIPDFSGLSFEVYKDNENVNAVLKIRVENSSGSSSDYLIGDERFSLNRFCQINNWYSVGTGSGNNRLRFYSDIRSSAPSLSDPNPGLTISELVFGNNGEGRVDWSLLSQGGAKSILNFGGGYYKFTRIVFEKVGSGNIWIRNLVVNGIHYDEGIYSYPFFTPTPTKTSTPTPKTELSDMTPVVIPQSTNTPTVTNTATSTPTFTSTPSFTATPTSTNSPTRTPTPTLMSGKAVTPMPTETGSPVKTPLPTSTKTFTPTQTVTPTSTNTPTSTSTPSFTATPTVTNTYAPTMTKTPTAMPETTVTPTSTATPTSKTIVSDMTPVVVPPSTNTPAPTETPRPTPTSKPTLVPVPSPGNHPPNMDNFIFDERIGEGEEVKIETRAEDEDGDKIYFSVLFMPVGAEFVSDVFRWTPDYESGSSLGKPYLVTFQAEDEHGAKSERNIVIYVFDRIRPTETMTKTPTITPTQTSTATATEAPTQTPVIIFIYPTPLPTETAIMTNTPVAPTNTLVPPTQTPVVIYVYPTSTATSVPPTATKIPSTPTPTPTKTKVPTLVPTKTSTPVPKPWNGKVFVLDEIGKALFSSVDVDSGDSGKLGISFEDFSNPDISQFHVYLKKDGKLIPERKGYVGRTSNGNGLFEKSLEFGHYYTFLVYALTKSGTPHHYGPNSSNTVLLLKEDSVTELVDGIGLAWKPVSGSIDYHVYVSEDGVDYSFVGHTGNGTDNFFVWRNFSQSEKLFFKIAALREGEETVYTYLGSIPEGLSEPTLTPIPTATKVPPTATRIPPTATPTVTPTKTVPTPTETKEPTPSPTMLSYFDWPLALNDFKEEDSLKWLRAGNLLNSPVWLAENSQVGWVRKDRTEADDTDGFAVLSSGGSLMNLPACFFYFFSPLSVSINHRYYLVLKIYAEKNEENKVLLPMVKYFSHNNERIRWVAPAALPSFEEIIFDGRSFSGHFVSFLLEDFSDSYYSLSDRIYIFLRGENGFSPFLLIDCIGLLTIDEINSDFWSGYRGALFELINASKSETGFSYCLPSLEILKNLSGEKGVVIKNLAGYPMKE